MTNMPSNINPIASTNDNDNITDLLFNLCFPYFGEFNAVSGFLISILFRFTLSIVPV